ncbi:hypothetical protein AB3X96_17375 [Paraburkholderia sp. BR13439]|uniref:Uncharacterized protein n=1 Tax=Paraburkholderia youngii TaxID=2782701 RepID=A0A7W8L2T1_9BURK|nr:hypothetical protein [Paraburkholderia youngii]MBB5399158.1 hypothetical protein [Paraburkholderia youngii]NUX56085.1 hypothetical protein [Paraburkholderia youngii]NVI07901.1 hypothetical protein [Paraburkholderia youngii]
MIELVLMCFVAGMVVALPVWIVWQRVGARRALAAMRGFDPRDAVPCEIEPVALRARLLPALDTTQDEVAR